MSIIFGFIYLIRNTIFLIRQMICALRIVRNSHLNLTGIGNGNEKYILVLTCMWVGTGMPISHPNPT